MTFNSFGCTSGPGNSGPTNRRRISAAASRLKISAGRNRTIRGPSISSRIRSAIALWRA
jgi:hypothetical protein